MHIDWWTLGLQAINAIILLWLLSRFLFKPVAAMIADRQTAAARIRTDAEALRLAAEAEKQAADAAKAAIATHRAEQMQAAAAAAENEKARLIAAAKADADALRVAARAEIDRIGADAEKRSAKAAAALAVTIAGRLLARLPDALLVTPFLPGLGSAIDALAPSVRAGLADGTKVLVPRPLAAAEAAALHALLAARLDAEIHPEITVDPALIAGIEIEGSHGAARNSLKADLDRIAAELARDGD